MATSASNNTSLAFGSGTGDLSGGAGASIPANTTSFPKSTSVTTNQAFGSGLDLAPTNPGGAPGSGGSSSNEAPTANGGSGKGASPRPRKISDIKFQLLQPATTSHFICKFQPPESVNNWQKQKQNANFAGAPYDSINTDLIEISCSEASLPGSTFATHDANNDYHGVSQKMAYRRLYDDRADFTFYVDTKYTTIRFFEGWMTYIANEAQADGFDRTDYFYRMNYPINYKTDTLILTKFEKNTGRQDSTPIMEYVFLEAFPIAVNSMPVSYEQSNLLKCTVSFSFSRYYARIGGASSDKSAADSRNPGNPEANKTSAEMQQALSQSSKFENPQYAISSDPRLNETSLTSNPLGSGSGINGQVGDFSSTSTFDLA